ncbi:hypothetical protein [Tepidimonas sp.]|uniref:hypothetical protein n=1 Tax=Tepidimonas sp. TaxID=2002775 RepID=UPI002FE28193
MTTALPLWIGCLPAHTDAAPGPDWLAHFAPAAARWQDGWVLRIDASARLFGGRAALLRRLWLTARAHGWHRLGAAPTALAALALARSTPCSGGWRCALGPDWMATLAPLPTTVLGADLAETLHALHAAGLHTLGDLQRCPRPALAARADPLLLQRLDALWGTAPLPAVAWTPQPVFDATLELPAPVTDAAAIAFAAQRLLGQLVTWLRQRRRGVLHWRLAWSATGGLDLYHHQPVQDAKRLLHLLQARLAAVRLDDAVLTLRLSTRHTVPWTPPVASLLPGAPAADALDADTLLERLSTRLGPQRVLRGVLRAHWDPQQRQRWHPASPPAEADAPPATLPRDRAARQPRPRAAAASRRAAWPPLDADTGRHSAAASAALPADLLAASLWDPPWRLPSPQLLPHDAHGRPWLDGAPLRCVLGPQRIATGWWEAAVNLQCCVACTPDGRLWAVQRDPARSRRWTLIGAYS